MKKSTKTLFGTAFTALSIVICLLLSGCGAKEQQGTLLGGATGAALGAAVAGDRGEGALIGGALGALVGGQMGRASDEEDKSAEDARRAREQRRKEEQLRSENRRLQHQLDKWCESCGKRVRIRGANSCPDCGGRLIQERFCDRCKEVFSPDTGYKYCPRCSVKVRLKGR